MRKRDPKHTARQALLQAQPKTEWLRQVAITDYKDPEYVASEVLAALIRVRFGVDTGQLDAAVNALKLIKQMRIKCLSQMNPKMLCSTCL